MYNNNILYAFYRSKLILCLFIYYKFIFILGNCTNEISTWKLDQEIEMSNDVENVLALNSKITVHNDFVNGVR